jgi:hypothetical protein
MAASGEVSQWRGKPMKALAATIALFVSSAAAAQEECKICTKAEACITAYHKAAAEAQRATKEAIRDWKENLYKKASAEFSREGTLALQKTMEAQVGSDIERLNECLSKIR